jgi:hypothetical protein
LVDPEDKAVEIYVTGQPPQTLAVAAIFPEA